MGGDSSVRLGSLRPIVRLGVTRHHSPRARTVARPPKAGSRKAGSARGSPPEAPMVSRPVFLGIDVSKATLDLAVRPSGETWQGPHDPAAMPALVTRVRAAAPALIVLEATGGFEHTVVVALATAGLPVVVANPRQVHDFGKATGQLAKTDRIDAALLALFAERVRPAVRPLPDTATGALSA